MVVRKIALAALVALFAVSQISAETKPTQAKPVVASAKPELLFFLNPQGAPCQMQNGILQKMGDTLSAKVNLKYVSTAEMATSRDMFMKYGIRALPSLILVDAKGAVIHRFTPGIQQSATIKAKIGG